MTKLDLLCQATQKLLSLLIEAAKTDTDLLKIIDENNALFIDIKLGLITPHAPAGTKGISIAKILSMAPYAIVQRRIGVHFCS